MSKKQFKAESKRMLDLMINSIYTNREIFLREIISNASDAIDKRYYEEAKSGKTGLSRENFEIRIEPNKDARTLTISDNGIGMSAEELEENLGIIAKSGSLGFKTENEEAAKDTDIIGQFGVGFYSAFMVAKHIEVTSRKLGEEQAHVWISDGADGYSVEDGSRDEVGTTVQLTLRDDTEDDKYDEFLEEYRLRSLVTKYSDYIRYPIVMNVEKSKMKEASEEEKAKEDYQPEYETYREDERLNSMVPIWKKKKSEITAEEYNEFYKTNFHDFADPARTVSLHAEGALTYDALLFVPSRAPYDLYSKDFKKGLALYSSNVLIMDKCEDLLPDYFNFVRGIVDSQDLTLNISRETLQHNSQLKAIARRVEKKIKSDLENFLEKDREGYEKFFENFGRGMKYGLYTSYGTAKDVLGDLLLFYSAKQKKMITFKEYVKAAADGQETIYYATGDSVERMAQLPIVTTVLAKGYDVLLCPEDVDEFCMMAMSDYAVPDAADPDSLTAWPLKNVGGENLGLESDEEKKEAEETAESNKDLFEAMKSALDGKVEKIAVSTRQTDAPAFITTEGGVSLKMEKILAGAPKSAEEEGAVKSHRVLEVNAKHPVFEVMQKAQESGDDEKVKLYSGILYDQALLVEGIPLDDPVAYTEAVTKLMK